MSVGSDGIWTTNLFRPQEQEPVRGRSLAILLSIGVLSPWVHSLVDIVAQESLRLDWWGSGSLPSYIR